MNDPSYAALYVQVGEIQLLCNIAVVQTLAHRAINRAQDARLFPKQRISYLLFDLNQALTGTNTWLRSIGRLPIYFVSCASAIRACWPASNTAFRNASALLGVD